MRQDGCSTQCRIGRRGLSLAKPPVRSALPAGVSSGDELLECAREVAPLCRRDQADGTHVQLVTRPWIGSSGQCGVQLRLMQPHTEAYQSSARAPDRKLPGTRRHATGNGHGPDAGPDDQSKTWGLGCIHRAAKPHLEPAQTASGADTFPGARSSLPGTRCVWSVTVCDPVRENSDLTAVHGVPLTTRVLFADDHPIVLRGLLGVLDKQPDFVVVAEARDGAEAVDLALSERASGHLGRLHASQDRTAGCARDHTPRSRYSRPDPVDARGTRSTSSRPWPPEPRAAS